MRNSIVFALFIFLAFSVQAGALKELVIDHQDAIAREVDLWGFFQIESISNTHFVTQKTDPSRLGLESQVLVLDMRSGQVIEVTCTSDFKKADESWLESRTSCETPDSE